MTSIERICAEPGKYSFDVDRLGECKIASPIRHHAFIAVLKGTVKET